MEDLFNDIVIHLKDEPINKYIDITEFIKQLPYSKSDTTDGTVIIFKTLHDLNLKNYVITNVVESDGQEVPVGESGQRYIEANQTITFGRLTANSYITNDGKIYLKQKDRAQLEDKKLDVDYKISKRIYKSYPFTQAVAWISFVVALFLGFLRLAEALKWWPFHK
jgi:hypothetical protein